MPTRITKHSRSTKIQSNLVSQAKQSLQDLPKKPQESFSSQKVIHLLHDSIESALSKGYTYPELSALLKNQGIEIKPSTLQRYHSSRRQADAKGRASEKPAIPYVSDKEMQEIQAKLGIAPDTSQAEYTNMTDWVKNGDRI